MVRTFVLMHDCGHGSFLPRSAGTTWWAGLFFVQHQFDGAYRERHANWDYATAAIAGCPYLKLPRVPDYNLQRAHDENPMFQQAHTFTLAQSVGLLRLALWDEQQKRPPPAAPNIALIVIDDMGWADSAVTSRQPRRRPPGG